MITDIKIHINDRTSCNKRLASIGQSFRTPTNTTIPTTIPKTTSSELADIFIGFIFLLLIFKIISICTNSTKIDLLLIMFRFIVETFLFVVYSFAHIIYWIILE